MKILLLLFIMLSCSEKQENRVIIYKQWHLSSKTDTTDITQSKTLPQYPNQISIYNEIVSYIKSSSGQVNFLSEGCEGDPDSEFKESYNGWTIDSLSRLKDKDNFVQILAPIGMKLLAKYKERVSVYCSDQKKLVRLHLAVYSDIRGLLNYYLKFNKLKVNSKEFDLYYKSFSKNYNTSKQNITRFIKNKILAKLEEFETLLYKRNDSFIKDAKKLSGTTFIVIGGLHTENLSNRLGQLKINNSLITPEGYDDKDDEIIQVLKSIIIESKDIHFSSVPGNFSIKKFPITYKLSPREIMTKDEENSLKKSLGSNQYLFEYLLSDFDKDGIRDFTLSTSEDLVIINAEDSDWDNDGALNLVDNSVGQSIVARINPNEFKSILGETVDSELLNKYFKKNNINLVTLQKSKHLVEILRDFQLVFEMVDKAKYDIKNIVVMEPKYTFGKEVFFSYNKTTSSLEYYPLKLLAYLEKKRLSAFKGISDRKFYSGYIRPLVIHSIAHELIHSRDFDIDLSANKWSLKKKSINSTYLARGRLKSKALSSYNVDTKYDSKTYKEWLFEHISYVKTLNLLLSKKTSFIELAKATPWYTNTKSKSKELQVSFLNYNNLVSLYSTHSPQEWVAENLAMCLFQKIYKLKKSVDLISKYEVLLGINPFGVDPKLCKSVKL